MFCIKEKQITQIVRIQVMLLKPTLSATLEGSPRFERTQSSTDGFRSPGACQPWVILKLTQHPWPWTLAGIMVQECATGERMPSDPTFSRAAQAKSLQAQRVQEGHRAHTPSSPSPWDPEIHVLAHMTQYPLSGNRGISSQLPCLHPVSKGDLWGHAKASVSGAIGLLHIQILTSCINRVIWLKRYSVEPILFQLYHPGPIIN